MLKLRRSGWLFSCDLWESKLWIGDIDFCRVGEFSRIEGRLASGMEKDLEIDKCGMLVLGLTVSLRLYWLGEMDDLGGGGSNKYFCV